MHVEGKSVFEYAPHLKVKNTFEICEMSLSSIFKMKRRWVFFWFKTGLWMSCFNILKEKQGLKLE